MSLVGAKLLSQIMGKSNKLGFTWDGLGHVEDINLGTKDFPKPFI